MFDTLFLRSVSKRSILLYCVAASVKIRVFRFREPNKQQQAKIVNKQGLNLFDN